MPPKRNSRNTVGTPASLDSVDVKLDSIIAEQLKLEKIILSLRTDIEEIKKVNIDLVSSNQGLLKENAQLNKKLDEINTRTVDNNHKLSVVKQTSFDSCIEIYGIEEKESENVNNIVEKIVETIDPTFVKQIKQTYRRRTRGPNSSIVVSLGSTKSKQEFLKKRKGTVLNTLEVFPGLKGADIFIYGYLIEETKRLLHSAHTLKKQGLIQDIWVRGSEIFIKTDIRGDHHKVVCNSDLNKLLDNRSVT